MALVEFVLVVPFLLIMLVGIIDFGFLFNDIISVRQGARDGGRQAAVGKFGSDPNCDLNLTANASNNARALMCLTKSRDDVPDDDTAVRLIVNDYALGKPVTICVQYRMRSITGLLGAVLKGREFTTWTTFRVEVKNSELIESAEEYAVDGGVISCPSPSPT